MKRHQPSFRQFWENFFGPFKKLPSPTVDRAWQRILDRDRLTEHFRAGDQLPAFEVEETPRRRWNPWVMATVAASLLAVVVSVVGVVAFRTSPDSFVAVAENQAKIRIGEPVQSASGMKLTLVDGSRLNMQPGSELSLYRAADDLCIQLVRGDLVVNAAKQEAGHHLCVQTTDFKVTVIGTVFTVRVEKRGSSVIVEEGTVWVQQGSTRKTLVAGERFSTIAAKPEPTHQVSALTAAPPAQAPPQARGSAKPSPNIFDVISIKKAPPNPDDDRPHRRITPGGVRANNATLKDLVLMAYNLEVFQLSGGPPWIDKDRFDVETRIGRELRIESQEQATQFGSMVHEMMQDMLATRFQLKVRRTSEQSAAYALVLAGKTSKLQAGEASGRTVYNSGSGSFEGPATIAQLAKFLSEAVGQPFVDRTGLPGIYDIKLKFVPESLRERLVTLGVVPGAVGPGRGRGGGRGGGGDLLDGPDLRSALQEQLGLKLEGTKAPVEFLVIESAEQPSEN